MSNIGHVIQEIADRVHWHGDAGVKDGVLKVGFEVDADLKTLMEEVKTIHDRLRAIEDLITFTAPESKPDTAEATPEPGQ